MLSLDGYKALSSKADPLCQGVAQWQARFVRDPEINIMVSKSEHRRGEVQWLAHFVRDEEAGGSSPLTPTNSLRNKWHNPSIEGAPKADARLKDKPITSRLRITDKLYSRVKPCVVEDGVWPMTQIIKGRV